MLLLFRSVCIFLVVAICHQQVEAQESTKVDVGFYSELPDGEVSVVDSESNKVLYYNPNRAICNNSNIIRVTLTLAEDTKNPVMEVEFDQIGSDAFAKATKENIGKKVLVIIDRKLYSAPTIRGASKNIQVTGTFNALKELAKKISQDQRFVTNIQFAFEWSRQIIEEDIKNLDQALIANNDSILNVLLNSRITFGHSNGWIQDKNAVLNDLKTGVLSYEQIKQDGDLKIDFGGEAASVRRIIAVKGKYKNEMFALRLSVLEVWLRYSGMKWQLWSRQSVKTN